MAPATEKSSIDPADGSGAQSKSDPALRSAPGLAKVGTKLGRYILEDVLGHGAMATVFRARDSQLGRIVAVKVMNLAIATRDDAGERFRREAQAVASLKHPGIVEIHDFAAATDDEPAYIVVELIEGPTLRTLLERRRGRLLPEVAALVAAEIADALAVAHAHGVVHRDVKPDNAMLEKTGASSRVVITDFGVAHITGLETMTATGALVGSPAYMAPEQARGQDTGPPADVWAVGVLLYQMATGALPFPGKEPLAVIAAIARGTFKRPSQVSAAASPELDQIVARCLKSQPAERYPGAGALAADLRRLTRDFGLDDERKALRRFLDDPDAFEAELRPKIAAAAVERARRHVRRGELARALSEIGRATAYVPDHHEAHAVLRSISARRRWMKIAGGAAALLALASISALGWRELSRPREEVVQVVERPAPPVAPPVPAPAPAPPAAAPAPRLDEPKAPLASSADGAKKTKKQRAKRDVPAPAQPVAAPVPVAVAAPEPVKEPEPPPAAAVEKPGQVTLRSWRGLCNPSLDDAPAPAQTKITYQDVKPGQHAVHCTQAGIKRRVGVINVTAGAAVDKNIIWENGQARF